MARSDLEAFIRERTGVWDETVDLTPGSPFDVNVVQPILNRLGADPFSMDLPTFIESRLQQEFPDLAVKSGDATTDLLEKPAVILWDPIVREISRVRSSQSFKDPSTLTVDEAEALGANLFAERNRGNFATGVVRIYFAAPQSITVAPANFVTSKTGLHFFPKSIQSIKTDEMLFNVEGSLFYFDVNLVAEKAGDEYNIGPDELITIANVTAAIRIVNKRRFRNGLPAETAVDFIDRAQQELTERSLVTVRGIAAVVPKTFPEITRLNVVGFNDPEMQRDVIKGGGTGPIQAFGVSGHSQPDGENKQFTRRVHLTEVLGLNAGGFSAIIGPIGPTSGWVLTAFDAFSGLGLKARDLDVLAVVDSTTLDLVDQVIDPSNALSFTWCLRKRELTLSGIPGGILFPDSPNGTVTIPDGEIHIGGCTDILVRGVDFDQNSLVISSIVDDVPIISGIALTVSNSSGLVVAVDYVLNGNYSAGDSVYTAIQQAALKGWTLQILEGPAAGSYRVLSTQQFPASNPQFTLTPPPPYAASPSFTNLRWKLTDILDVDLVEPKETKVAGSDLFSVQNLDQLETAGGTDFDSFGVAPNDIIRIFNGPEAGDFAILQVLSPFFTRVQVDRPLKFSVSGLQYAIFRKNATGGVVRPLMRITSIDLLDTSGQPVGSTIPYANPVDAQSTAFANVGKGVRAEGRDGLLGLVGPVLSGGTPGANVNGKDITIRYNNGLNTATVVFAGVDPIPLTTIVAQVNAAVGQNIAVVIGGNRFGLVPIGDPQSALPSTDVVGGVAMPLLLGGLSHGYHSSREINSATVTSLFGTAGWSAIKPSVDIDLDVLQVVDGRQIGFYDDPVVLFAPLSPPAPGGLNPAAGLTVAHDFAPEAGVFFQFGSRSIGSARVFFLEPTSIEFPPEARFTVLTATGQSLNFKPDPSVNAQVIPPLPSGVKPLDGDTSDASLILLHSASTDFIQKGLRSGDILVLDYVPITGTVDLPDPIPGLQFLTLVISVNGGPDKTITFLTDSLSIPANAVTRAGVVSQINQSVGQVICSIAVLGASNFLEFYPDAAVAIRGSGTANTALLGAPFTGGTSNTSDNLGSYILVNVAQHDLTVDITLPPFGFATHYTRQQFKVYRARTQRIGSTQMSTQKADAGLYYFDVQLVSEGSGDLWNIDASLQMTASGFDSDGYFLSTPDPNLTFSPTEQETLHISKSIREVGVSDDPDNATQLSGQNIQVNYEYSSLATALNNFVLSETERVVNESPLGRHLVPHFVRFDLTYGGGSKESIVIPELEKLIRNVQPQDALEVSDIEQVVLGKGADSILNPLDLIAVVHNFDRSILLNRSNDKLTTTRLAAFIPDQLNVVRKMT